MKFTRKRPSVYNIDLKARILTVVPSFREVWTSSELFIGSAGARNN